MPNSPNYVITNQYCGGGNNIENNIEEYAYYCPYCGEPPKEGQALMKYGDAHYWDEFLLLEMQDSTVSDTGSNH